MRNLLLAVQHVERATSLPRRSLLLAEVHVVLVTNPRRSPLLAEVPAVPVTNQKRSPLLAEVHVVLVRNNPETWLDI